MGILLLSASLSAQTPADSLLFRRDTLPPVTDTLKRSIRIAESVDAPVEYGARDSMWFDVKKRQLHLWGQAFVNYTSLRVQAGYILLDYSKNEISAQQFPDSAGVLTGLPEFKDGDQTFNAYQLRYNFKSKKGIIYEARTKQEDLYVLGEKAKFIGSETVDTTQKARNTIYNKDAIITTCDAPDPHFGIHTQKLKVIPDKLVVTGLSNLEIGGVPTPLVLPFGFYPITKTRKAGLIIPRDFEFADAEGFGLRDFGWYQPISEHMDMTTTFNAYVSGSFGATGNLRYNYKYKSSGNFTLSINNRVNETPTAQRVSARSFGLRWTHNQDNKAHPTRRFNGTVNIETNRNQNRNFNNFDNVFQNTLTSNLNYNQLFPGKPYQFNASFSHTQNTFTRQMSITLPQANFTVQRIFPFRRKERVGNERWYEKLSFTYSSSFRNSFETADTLLFTRQTLEKARLGMQHRASTDYTFKVFKYINVAPNINYEENWYPYIIDKKLLDEVRPVYKKILIGDDSITVLDSARTQFGVDTTFRDWGFYSYRNYTAGVSANTVLFFTKQFKGGWFRGLRHTLKPSVSTNFGPDYTRDRYQNLYRTVETDLRKDPRFNDTLTYTIFDEGIFGRPPTTASRRDVILGYSLLNVLEIKYFSKRDSTAKKVPIFNNLTFSGNYNVTADSLHWSTVSTGGLFRLFKGMSVLTWNATFDPYIADGQGRRLNRTMLKEKGRLLRTTQFGIQLNTNFTIGEIRDRFTRKGDREQQLGSGTKKPVQQQDDFVDWLKEFRISHRISFDRRLIPTGIGTSRDTFIIGTNNISLSGRIPLNSKWSIDIGNISYDLINKQMVYPDLGFSRDLHCWQMSLSWQPLRGTYLFSLQVKPGTLDFLKIPYRKNNFDGRLSL